MTKVMGALRMCGWLEMDDPVRRDALPYLLGRLTGCGPANDVAVPTAVSTLVSRCPGKSFHSAASPRP